MSSLKAEIISTIKRNKISTTEIADAMGKRGHVKGLLPLNSQQHKVGEVSFVYAFNESNWEVHEQIQFIPEDRIVYVHAIDCGDRAIFGDLVAKYLLLYKNSVAIAVNGLMRDAHSLKKEQYPIWCTGVSPIGCFNKKNKELPSEKDLQKLKSKFEGGIMVCDDSGVVLIEEKDISEKLLQKLHFIELQEDVWFFCMDTKKMSTYDIVCAKKYIVEEGIIEKKQLEQLLKFSNKLDG